ncbi:MAG: Citrate synthase [Deltaproteobacteria bacterium ADurb.Bin510]|nr:MAG: Citrate synthase [Deltaproteobacteria bacterium ADurb.Bin510]
MLVQDTENFNQMFALHSVVSHLARCADNPDSTDIRDVTDHCIDLIAKLPTIVAYNYNVMRYRKGGNLSIIKPEPQLSTAENFLYMLKGKIPTEFEAYLFDMAMILHMEHGGGNNSTFTVRTVSSSGANTYMAICAGIASLSGHLHGGLLLPLGDLGGLVGLDVGLHLPLDLLLLRLLLGTDDLHALGAIRIGNLLDGDDFLLGGFALGLGLELLLLGQRTALLGFRHGDGLLALGDLDGADALDVRGLDGLVAQYVGGLALLLLGDEGLLGLDLGRLNLQVAVHAALLHLAVLVDLGRLHQAALLDLVRSGLLLTLGTDLGHLGGLRGFGIGLVQVQVENLLTGLDVLVGDGPLGIALVEVSLYPRRLGDLGDLAEALGVEDVVLVQALGVRLIQS